MPRYAPMRPRGWISVGLSNPDDGDHFRIAFENVERYLRYLDAICERVARSRLAYVAVSDDLQQRALRDGCVPTVLLVQTRDIIDSIKADVEAFYLFSRILLDNVWAFLHFLFVDEHGPEKITISRFRNELVKYAERKGLSRADGILERHNDLYKRVTAIRDKFVVHSFSVRIIGAVTVPGSPSQTPIAQFSDFGNDGPRFGQASEDLNVLLAELRSYVDKALSLIDANPGALRYKFDGATYQQKLDAQSKF